MRIGTRGLFNGTHAGWSWYVGWLERPTLIEVRTLDPKLNEHARGRPDIECELDDIDRRIPKLPVPRSGHEYYLLAEQCEGLSTPTAVPGFDFLGYDLCDETLTSSLLNCGPWTGELQPLAARSNRYGLLGWEDALRAKVLLPQEWGEGERHAWVNVWTLFGANGWRK